MPSYLLLFTADLRASEPKGPPAFAACLAFLLDVLGSLPVLAGLSLSFWGMMGAGGRETGSAWQ